MGNSGGGVFVDDGISGAEFANRPGFLRLMNALKPLPPLKVLVRSEESRLGREAIETAYALKRLVTAGVRVFFYLEGSRAYARQSDRQDSSLVDDFRRRARAREGTTTCDRCNAAEGPVGSPSWIANLTG